MFSDTASSTIALSQAQSQRWERDPLDLDGPEITAASRMSGSERAGTDNFSRTQRLAWKSPCDGRAEFRQA